MVSAGRRIACGAYARSLRSGAAFASGLWGVEGMVSIKDDLARKRRRLAVRGESGGSGQPGAERALEILRTGLEAAMRQRGVSGLLGTPARGR